MFRLFNRYLVGSRLLTHFRSVLSDHIRKYDVTDVSFMPCDLSNMYVDSFAQYKTYFMSIVSTSVDERFRFLIAMSRKIFTEGNHATFVCKQS